MISSVAMRQNLITAAVTQTMFEMFVLHGRSVRVLEVGFANTNGSSTFLMARAPAMSSIPDWNTPGSVQRFQSEDEPESLSPAYGCIRWLRHPSLTQMVTFLHPRFHFTQSGAGILWVFPSPGFKVSSDHSFVFYNNSGTNLSGDIHCVVDG